MPPPFSNDEINVLFTLSKRFDFYLEAQNLDSDHHVVEQLLGDERELTFAQVDRPYVAAWVAWHSIFYHDRTSVWMLRGWKNNQVITDMLADLYQLDGKYLPGLITRNVRQAHFDNGSTIFCLPATEYAARGLSIHNIVMEGVAPHSTLMARLQRVYYPVWSLSMGRIITLV